MFKPHYGKCTECEQQRLLVVKRGWCARCNKLQKDVGKLRHNAKFDDGRRENDTRRDKRTIWRNNLSPTDGFKSVKKFTTTISWKNRKKITNKEGSILPSVRRFSSSKMDGLARKAKKNTSPGANSKHEKGSPACRKEGAPQAGKKAKPIQYRRKRTGEAEVFKKIWEENEHKCSCCPNWLGESWKPIFFSHLLSKGAYPSLRLEPQNIVLKCPQCHDEWEFGNRNQPKFKWCLKKAEELKREYYDGQPKRNTPQ